MRAFTCALLALSLMLLTCAGCDSGGQAKKQNTGGPSTPPGTGAGQNVDQTGPTGTGDSDPASVAKPAGENPPEDKKADEQKSGDEKAGDEKKPEAAKPNENKPE